jgi:hypothetical protein
MNRQELFRKLRQSLETSQCILSRLKTLMPLDSLSVERNPHSRLSFAVVGGQQHCQPRRDTPMVQVDDLLAMPTC